MFNREDGSAFWAKDSRHIQLCAMAVDSQRVGLPFLSAQIDAVSGVVQKSSANTFHELYNTVPAQDGRGYLTVEIVGDSRHLIQEEDPAHRIKDYGKVDFNDIRNGYGLGAWSDQLGRRLILAVDYNDRQGLAMVPASRTGRSLARITDSLSNCSLAKDISYGVCVRESLTTAPELVDVRIKDGAVTTLIRLNSRYSRIRPLRFEPAEWTNRFGSRSSGYITYPGSYVDGQKYPTLVVTHAHGAINRFANDSFQWEFPIQVLADRGYFVLSVNEPPATATTRVASDTRVGIQGGQSVPDMQFAEAFDAISSMEAAIKFAVEKGFADPNKTGIAGYSRGSEVVEWVMTQSKLFHAAIEGDAGRIHSGWILVVRLGSNPRLLPAALWWIAFRSGRSEQLFSLYRSPSAQSSSPDPFFNCSQRATVPVRWRFTRC